MEILHLNNYYIDTTLYHQLYTNISKLNVNQSVFMSLKKERTVPFLGDLEYNIFPVKNMNWMSKFFYFNKIKKNLEQIVSKIDVKKFDLVHAHNLFGDGALAYEINKKYGINYIVAVRNTDIYKFFKYFVHTRKYGIHILMNAKKVIFINHHYHQKISAYFPNKLRNVLKNKSIVIPNGMDDFWHKNRDVQPIRREIKHVLFVGEITKNKNIKTLIKSIDILNKKNNQYFKLQIIGRPVKTKSSDLKMVQGAQSKYRWLDYIGQVSNKETLLNHYRKAFLLVIPSFKENFGIVFIEALSQNTRIIYSKGQGIDGYFTDKAGYAVNPKSYIDLAHKIELVFKEKNNSNTIDLTEFNWSKIANKYVALYNKIILNNDKY